MPKELSNNPDPIAIWERKLAYFQQQEAILSDPAQKFQLQQQIKECIQKLVELRENNLSNTQINEIAPIQSPIIKPVERKQVDLIIPVFESPAKTNKDNPKYQIGKMILAIPQSKCLKSYTHLNIEGIVSEDKSYDKNQLKTIIEKEFDRLIEKTVEKYEEELKIGFSREIFIEFIVPKSLLSCTFECWENHTPTTGTGLKLCVKNKICIRLSDRQERKYLKAYAYDWEERWDIMLTYLKNNQNLPRTNYKLRQDYKTLDKSIFNDNQVVGINISPSLDKLDQQTYNTFLVNGIPIAIWSRCSQNQNNHCIQIDQIIQQGNNNHNMLVNPSQLADMVAEVRNNNNNNNLCDHLCFLWENPYNYPRKTTLKTEKSN